jgi:phosphoribosylaminoimidazole-succinocarboxamide synthase
VTFQSIKNHHDCGKNIKDSLGCCSSSESVCGLYLSLIVDRSAKGLTFNPFFVIYHAQIDDFKDCMRQRTQLVDAENNTLRTRNGELVYEGQEKKLTQADTTDFFIQEFKFIGIEDAKKRTRTKNLSVLRNEISCYLFEYLEGFHIPTHFVRKVSDAEMMVKRLELLPLVIRIFNIATAMFEKRFGMKQGSPLEFPVIEHYYNSVEHDTSWLNEHHIYAFGILTPEEFKQLNRLSSKINAVLRALCDRRQLMLASIQLKFGRFKDQLTLGDELSPLTCHFYDLAADNEHARDRFLWEQDNADETLAELRNRLQLKV